MSAQINAKPPTSIRVFSTAFLKGFSMSAETWKSIADWATIVLIALTVVSGSAALILGDGINEKQAEQLRKFNKDLATQQERAAEAEKQLVEVKKRQEPRGVPIDKFRAAISGAPPSTAIMQYQDGSPEIALFAQTLQWFLITAGWKVPTPTPVPSIINSKSTALADIILTGKRKSLDGISDPHTSIGALWKALQECGYHPGGVPDDDLPDDTVRILIGPKL